MSQLSFDSKLIGATTATPFSLARGPKPTAAAGSDGVGENEGVAAEASALGVSPSKLQNVVTVKFCLHKGQHSVPLLARCVLEPMLTHELERAAFVLLTITNVTDAAQHDEAMKVLVRRRFELSYVLKAPDKEVADVFSREMVFRQEGTQLPSSEDSAKMTGVECYLEQRWGRREFACAARASCCARRRERVTPSQRNASRLGAFHVW